MMRSLTTFSLAALLPFLLFSQQRVDGSFSFQNENKLYSIYVPSAYQAGVPHRMMLGLHPLNTNRWDGESWCDTLIVFAENNDLLLICPDGGPDGAIDDPIDTAFTTALLDSVYTWYDVDMDKRYAMGFSWGGKTTYTYGLLRPNIFNGYLPIGAAINGTNEVNSTMQMNSSGKPVYIVHGANDAPATRFYPVLNALNGNNAITNSILMPGVGHTIDFTDRNAILGTAYQWIDSVNCANVTTVIDGVRAEPLVVVTPTIISPDMRLQVNLRGEEVLGKGYQIHNMSGKMISSGKLITGINRVSMDGYSVGTYLIVIPGAVKRSHKFIIVDADR